MRSVRSSHTGVRPAVMSEVALLGRFAHGTDASVRGPVSEEGRPRSSQAVVCPLREQQLEGEHHADAPRPAPARAGHRRRRPRARRVRQRDADDASSPATPPTATEAHLPAPRPPRAPPTPPAAAATAGATIEDGVLTIATGEPAFFPWVIDDAPETGRGLRGRGRLRRRRARWATRATPSSGCAPPSTRRSSPARRTSTSTSSSTRSPRSAGRTSTSRCPTTRATRRSSPSTARPPKAATSIADLKDVKFGAQVGTTSLDFITEVIQPDQDPFVYDDNVGAKAALEANQIDAAVFDLPTALFVSAVEIEGVERDRPVQRRRRRHHRPVRASCSRRTARCSPASTPRSPRSPTPASSSSSPPSGSPTTPARPYINE